MKIGIVGYGKVGKHLHQLFSSPIHDVRTFDKYDNGLLPACTPTQINECDLVFIAVPTPANSEGGCDLKCCRRGRSVG